MDTAAILFDLQRRYALDWKAHAPIHGDVVAWSGTSDEAQAALYDRVAAELARGYFDKRYSYEFCDTVVNQLYALMISEQMRDPPPPWPELFWRVFEAFDAGEYYRNADMTDNPIAQFTDPAIAEIIREL